MIKNMEGKSFEDRLRYLGSWTLEERRNSQDLIELFKIFKGLSRVRIDELFMSDENMKGINGHSLKLRKIRCTRDIKTLFLANVNSSSCSLYVIVGPSVVCLSSVVCRL